MTFAAVLHVPGRDSLLDTYDSGGVRRLPPSPHPPPPRPQEEEKEEGEHDLKGALSAAAGEASGKVVEGLRGALAESGDGSGGDACAAPCLMATCGKMQAKAPIECSAFVGLGCACTGCCAGSPAPPPPASCSNPCIGQTCGDLPGLGTHAAATLTREHRRCPSLVPHALSRVHRHHKLHADGHTRLQLRRLLRWRSAAAVAAARSCAGGGHDLARRRD